ncbi:protein DOWNSTREAM OF FLC-like [Syzygium oleosum]|uniref:protein DOWNSTREAM OF FLC-like n=1 Tax=Syzygium oleosum TaxID=219896 RepID=UPI0011D28B2F|nr:protein DOWNSTREAM OF FLC-like [Syzygium oleosum]
MGRSMLGLLLGVCVMLPCLVSASYSNRRAFYIQGTVYCDTCRFGFETPASHPIAGAAVRIECKDSTGTWLAYSVDTVTDSDGKWEATVEDDHDDQNCNAVLLSSPEAGCQTVDPGRGTATLILTRSNGAIASRHHANSMGCLKDEPLDGCANLRAYYQLDSNE